MANEEGWNKIMQDVLIMMTKYVNCIIFYI